MTTFRLASPSWLFALAAALLVVAWLAWRRRGGALLYSSLAPLQGVPVTLAQRVKRLLPFTRLVALTLICLALARPQRGLEEFRVHTEGLAILMTLDKSGSMRALDFELEGRRVNRLEVVKRTFREFVEGTGTLAGRPDDRIGLVAFGGFAEDRCPLTLDHGALLQVLDTVKIPEPLVDKSGRVVNQRLYEEELSTAIGDALALGVERLKCAPEKSKVLILLSDGANDAGVIDPLEAAAAAKALGVKIYAIGVGSNRPVPVPATDPFGREVLVQRVIPLDEALMKEVAGLTGGRYFNAQDTAALEGVYGEIDQLEKTRGEGVLYTDHQELFRYALWPAAVLLLLELVLAATRLRTLP